MANRIRQTRVAIVLLGSLLMTPGAAVAVPGWPAGNGTAGPMVPGPERLRLQCPRAYAGIKGDLLPTDWTATDSGQPAALIKSQVQRGNLYCVYRIPTSSRMGHASVRRRVPAGYRCESDGAGRFDCRRSR